MTAPYTPAGPVVDGVEVATNRLACCGAGPDRRCPTCRARQHFSFCPPAGDRIDCLIVCLEQQLAAWREARR